MGKVFTDVGLKWKPTGRLFTIVGKSCPLTRITPKKIVHLKETTSNSVETPKLEIKVYSMRPKQINSVGSSKKPKTVESKIANNSKPNHLWGSNATDVLSSSSLVNDRFLRSKDEALDAIIKCIKNIQVRLNAIIRNVRTNNETEFTNQTLCDFYENVGISHQNSVARTPQQNGFVERRNQTLVEAARIMLIFLKAHLFLLAEAINKACYTQNRSLIRLCYNKTLYDMIHDKKPNLFFFYVFGSLCYPTNDHEDLGKLNAKVDIGIFVGYSPTKKAFRIYDRLTQKIMETIHVTFNELTTMASEQFVLGHGLQSMTPATTSLRLAPNTILQQHCNPQIEMIGIICSNPCLMNTSILQPLLFLQF
nr:retrovirus-related Pol polyprotein from transposon TNT 1-94 [Tanacetum cinerariifolium]